MVGWLKIFETSLEKCLVCVLFVVRLFTTTITQPHILWTSSAASNSNSPSPILLPRNPSSLYAINNNRYVSLPLNMDTLSRNFHHRVDRSLFKVCGGRHLNECICSYWNFVVSGEVLNFYLIVERLPQPEGGWLSQSGSVCAPRNLPYLVANPRLPGLEEVQQELSIQDCKEFLRHVRIDVRFQPSQVGVVAASIEDRPALQDPRARHFTANNQRGQLVLHRLFEKKYNNGWGG